MSGSPTPCLQVTRAKNTRLFKGKKSFPEDEIGWDIVKCSGTWTYRASL